MNICICDYFKMTNCVIVHTEIGKEDCNMPNITMKINVLIVIYIAALEIAVLVTTSLIHYLIIVSHDTS